MPRSPTRVLVVERRSMSPLVRQFLDDAGEHVALALGVADARPSPVLHPAQTP